MAVKEGWKPFDPVGLIERLRRVQVLLRQAAAVGLAQDTERLERMVELQRRMKEEDCGPRDQRRYR